MIRRNWNLYLSPFEAANWLGESVERLPLFVRVRFRTITKRGKIRTWYLKRHVEQAREQIEKIRWWQIHRHELQSQHQPKDKI